MPANKVLIIKTGYAESLDYDLNSRKVSLGDVFRTTPLLHLFKDSKVSWATDVAAVPLLEGNPLIDRIMIFDQFLPFQLQRERFDTLVNLEKVPGICAIADGINAWKKYGFRLDGETGRAEAYDHAFEVLAVSADPELKRANKRTAQDLLFSMLGEKWAGEEYVLGYTPTTSTEYDVALNTLVGQKWPNKAWPNDRWDQLEKRLVEHGLRVTRQNKQPSEVREDLHKYIDWLNTSRVIVTNDSLGLHLGLALKKQVLGLFGPTPASEVYFYGRGEAIVAPVNCPFLPCFKGKCLTDNYCISKIDEGVVLNKIQDCLREKEREYGKL